jgi:hypothetical protein
MNAKQEQIQNGLSADAAESKKSIAPEANAAGLTQVTDKELDRVEGGYGIGTRTGDFPGQFIHRR